MNYGAKLAKGDILYFLHADSFPPANFDQQIINEIDKNNYAGCFRLKFDNDDHFLLKISSWSTRINLQLFRGGDQSLFITKAIFNEIYRVLKKGGVLRIATPDFSNIVDLYSDNIHSIEAFLGPIFGKTNSSDKPQLF